ncbi:MAG: leucine-rich repeat protein [Ruminococcus sp.]|nr:leucine-rich repeat protein [Ruminococcus sp.]
MKLKRKSVSLIATVIAVTALPVNMYVYAEDETITSGDYVYSVNEDGTVCIEQYCGTKTELDIPETIDEKNVTSLGKKAFSDNKSVNVVRLGAGISEINEMAFLNSVALKEIKVSDDNKSFDDVDGVLYSEGVKQLLVYPQGRQEPSFVIPDTVETIGISAIYDTLLEEITFPSSLSAIERHGVSYNTRLKEVDILNTSVDELGDFAFAYCTSLETLVLPDELLYIGSGSFAGCGRLTEVDIPYNVLTIGQNAFAATGMKSVVIPSSVEEIGYCAFGYDENLEVISDFKIYGVSGSMAQLYATDKDADYEYYNNFDFEAIKEIEGVTGKLRAKKEGSIEYVTENNEAYIVGYDALEVNPVIPSEIEGFPVTRIYMGAFFTSTAEKIELPNTVKTIDRMAFTDCSYLKEIVIPESVEEIGDEAFAGCSKLETITLPVSLKTIGKNLFDSCTSLKEIKVAEGNTAFASENGILFDAAKEVLIRYPYALIEKEYKIPDGVKKIGEYAFLDVKSLTSVELNEVTEISMLAFCGCSNLKEINITKEITTIGEYAFYDCNSLKSVRLHDTLTSIGKDAFGYTEKSDHSGSMLMKDFKIFTDKDTKAKAYADENGIECVTNSIEIMGKNVNKGFFAVVIGAIVAVIAVMVSKPVSKSIKKKKAKKAREENKNRVAESLNDDFDSEGYESVLGGEEDDDSDEEEN